MSRPVTADQCRGCPFPDQTAALELVRLREGIRALAEDWEGAGRAMRAGVLLDSGSTPGQYFRSAAELRALLDDNQGERS